MQPKDLKIMEQLIKSHESNSKRNLQSIKSSMSRFAQKLGSCKHEMFGEVETNISEIKSQLQMLLAFMEGSNDFNIKIQVNLKSIILYYLIMVCNSLG